MSNNKNLLLALTILISSCSNPKLLVDENKIIHSFIKENKTNNEIKDKKERLFKDDTIFYSDSEDKNFIDYGASGGVWLNGIEYDSTHIKKAMEKSKESKSIPIFVQYSIPNRDEGGASAGGAETHNDYINQIVQNSLAIGDNEVVIIMEPDTLNFSLKNQDDSKALLIKEAIEIYRKNIPQSKIFIDAGNSAWTNYLGAEKMAHLLIKAGIENANGFSLNVSNFQLTEDSLQFGDKLLNELSKIDSKYSNKTFVIDTSRNGNGPPNSEIWGDPINTKEGLPIKTGIKPTINTKNDNCSAFLWIKPPGEGDGRLFKAGEYIGKQAVQSE